MITMMKKSTEKASELFKKISSPKDFAPRRKWAEHAWPELLHILHSIKSFDEFQSALNIIVGDFEKKKMITHAKTIVRIKEGVSYRKINEELGTSLQTTSNIKKALEIGNYQGYWLRERKEKENIKQREKLIRRQAQEGPATRSGRRTKYGKIRW